MLVFALILFAVAAFTAGVGVAGLTGRLPRNRYLGVTTDAALRDDETFRLVNRAAAPTTLVAAGLLAVGAVAAVLMGGPVGLFVALVAAGTAVFTAGSGVSLATRTAEALAPAACGSACATCTLSAGCAR